MAEFLEDALQPTAGPKSQMKNATRPHNWGIGYLSLSPLQIRKSFYSIYHRLPSLSSVSG